jgi:hypothetical protein
MFTKQAVRSSIVALALTGLTAAPSVARPEGAPATPSQHPHAAIMFKDYSKNGANGEVTAQPPRATSPQDLRAPDSADAQSASSTGRPGVPPRTEGMGVQPQHGPYAASQPTPTVTPQALHTTSASSSVDWTPILLGALGVLVALVTGLVARSALRRRHTARVA